MCFIDILLQFQFHKENKISNPRVYILLKNYPWHPGPTKHERNMKQTWKSTCQSAGHCHTLLWCCSAFHWYPFCNFSSTKTKSKSSTPGSTYSKTIAGIQGLHTTQKLSLPSRVYTTQNLSLAFRVYITWNMKKSTGQRSRALFYFALML